MLVIQLLKLFMRRVLLGPEPLTSLKALPKLHSRVSIAIGIKIGDLLI
jgi:hypothetical protein